VNLAMLFSKDNFQDTAETGLALALALACHWHWPVTHKHTDNEMDMDTDNFNGQLRKSKIVERKRFDLKKFQKIEF
jgi:hypothetical protein